MTMQARFTTKILLALLAALTCAGFLAVGALASTGGAVSPAAGTPVKVHKTALATWFGPGFYGQQTACGQTLTPATVGVANRKLPCGTLVKVSYHHQRLTLPVVDRGPYANGADWDLTAAAAQTLGIEETVHIATVVVGAVPNTPSLGLPAVSPAATLTGGAVAG
ncbi:MAG TPA: septal ring lytic transglycosylase RlpA family protein [Solirubrobacteraceae bacterium]|jgi:rare lipoprotein A|nr:septal ring lytic transglycosylase RlpA family protein [Solirubrobacteraceae bacterium]